MKNTRKKLKKLIKRKNTRKKYRGGTSDIEPKTELEQKSLDELQKIKDDREKANAEASSKMLEDASTLATGVTTNTLEGIGKVVGVDITDPKEAAEDLDNIKKTVSDPKNIEKVKEIVSEAAKQGAVIFQAAQPLVGPVVDTAIEQGEKVFDKSVDALSTTGANLIKEIPGVGLVVTGIQDLSKIGEAASAAVGATSEIITQTADSAVVFDKNLKELKKEGEITTNRTNESIKEFETPTIPEVPAVKGGYKNKSPKNKSPKKTNKKNISKTKKVRFAL
jgi:hypothetical protein